MDARSEWLIEVASHYLGVEEAGLNAGPEVERFQRAAGTRTFLQPWCCAFVQFCVTEVDREFGPRVGPNCLFPTWSCLTLWRATPRMARCQARPRAVIVWRWTRGSRGGHVGIITAVNADGTFSTIEADILSATGARSDPGGVHARRRPQGPVGALSVLGCLDPWP
jgi:hypothetical protein